MIAGTRLLRVLDTDHETAANLGPLSCVLGLHEEGELLDDTEIRAFLRDGYSRLVGAVALVTGSLVAAEDAVQEAVVRAWERIDRGERIEKLEGWVATVAFNLSRSGLRRLNAERRARARMGAGAGHVAGPSSDRLDVARALAALPRRQREAVVLRYFLELSTAEVARTMGTSEGTVKSQLARARGHLAQALALNDEPERESHHAEA
jgi:RNA polymerase sigma-70 factor (ECF subfamily)